MEDLKVRGEIVKISEPQTFGENGFTKLELTICIDKDTQYPQTVLFEVHGAEKCETLEKFNKEGSNVEVSFNLRGREWTNPRGETKVFNTLVAWKVWKLEAQPVEESGQDLPFD